VHDTHLAAALMGRLHKLGFKDHQNVTVASILLNTGLLHAAGSLNIHHIAAICVDKGQAMLAMKLASESGDSSLQAFLVNIVSSSGQDKLAWKMLQVFNLPPALFASLGESRVLQHLKWLTSTAEVHDSLIDSFLRCQPQMGVLLCQNLLAELGAGSLRVRKYCTMLGVGIEGVRSLSTREVLQAAQTTPRPPVDVLQLPRFVERVLVSTSAQLGKIRNHQALRSTRYIGLQTFWVPNIPQFGNCVQVAGMLDSAAVSGIYTASSSRLGTPSRRPPGLNAPQLPMAPPSRAQGPRAEEPSTHEAGCLLTVSPSAPVFVCMLAISTNTHVFLLDLISLSAQISDEQLNDAILSVLNPAHPNLAAGPAGDEIAHNAMSPSASTMESGHFVVPGISAVQGLSSTSNSPSAHCSSFTVPALCAELPPRSVGSHTPPRSLAKTPEAHASPLVWGDTVWTPTRTEVGGALHPQGISWAKEKPLPVTGNGSALVESLREAPAAKLQSKWAHKQSEQKRPSVAPVILAYNINREIAHWASCFPNVPALSKANMAGGAVDVASVISASVQPHQQQTAWPNLADLCDLVYDKPLDRSAAMCDWGQRPLPLGAKSYACLQAYALVDLTLKMDVRWGNFKWKKMHPARVRAVSAIKWGHIPTGKGTLALKPQAIGARYEAVEHEAESAEGRTGGSPNKPGMSTIERKPTKGDSSIRPTGVPQVSVAPAPLTLASQTARTSTSQLVPAAYKDPVPSALAASSVSSGMSTPPFLKEFTFNSQSTDIGQASPLPDMSVDSSEDVVRTAMTHIVSVPSGNSTQQAQGTAVTAGSAHQPHAALHNPAVAPPKEPSAVQEIRTQQRAKHGSQSDSGSTVVGLKGFKSKRAMGGNAASASSTSPTVKAKTVQASAADIHKLKAGSYAAALFK